MVMSITTSLPRTLTRSVRAVVGSTRAPPRLRRSSLLGELPSPHQRSQAGMRPTRTTTGARYLRIMKTPSSLAWTPDLSEATMMCVAPDWTASLVARLPLVSSPTDLCLPARVPPLTTSLLRVADPVGHVWTPVRRPPSTALLRPRCSVLTRSGACGSKVRSPCILAVNSVKSLIAGTAALHPLVISLL